MMSQSVEGSINMYPFTSSGYPTKMQGVLCGSKDFFKYLNRSTNIITTNTEYTIDPQSKIEETTFYYYQTLRVGQHHTMDPIMEGILSCSLASSRGQPPNELPLQIQYFSPCLITLLEPLYIVLPSPKNILEEESSRSRTF
jgi:hypothetical protein